MGAPLDWSFYDPSLVKLDGQLTVDNTVGGVKFSTVGSISGIIGVLCTVETASIRITEDGKTAPTTTVGTLFNVGDKFVVWGSLSVANFRAIASTATSATLDVQFLGTK